MEFSDLSRRERQIAQVVYATDGATVHQNCSRLPDPPTTMAARRMLASLLEKAG
jgi:hypothetical protein